MNSKSQNLYDESTNKSIHFEHNEVESPSPLDERHERTGSVKFADQSDDGKEVLKY